MKTMKSNIISLFFANRIILYISELIFPECKAGSPGTKRGKAGPAGCKLLCT